MPPRTRAKSQKIRTSFWLPGDNPWRFGGLILAAGCLYRDLLAEAKIPGRLSRRRAHRIRDYYAPHSRGWAPAHPRSVHRVGPLPGPDGARAGNQEGNFPILSTYPQVSPRALGSGYAKIFPGKTFQD